MTLMERRRALMAASGGGESWDYTWDYTDGTPESKGMGKNISGSASGTLTNSGLEITADTSGYIRYTMPTASMTTGVMEVDIIPTNMKVGVQNFRFSASNGTDGAQINARGGYLCSTDSERSEDTQLAQLSQGKNHTIRLVLRNTNHDVYLDGVLVGQNIANNTILYCYSNRFWQQNGGTTIVKAVRMMINRIS